MRSDAAIWTLDLGSSRAKLQLYDLRALRVEQRLEFASADMPNEPGTPGTNGTGGIPAALAAALGAAPAAPLAVSAVGGSERLAAWRRALEPSVSRLCVAPDPGLDNATRTPESVGRDRLYAARGALCRGKPPLLVVDVGTAFTIDAVGPPKEAAGPGPMRPRFLGGAIGAGPELCARALAEACALPRVEPSWAGPALGLDSHEALRAGVGIGTLGALRELVQRIGAEAGFASNVQLFLTGGAAADLEHAAFAPHPVEFCPDLVHEGLRAAALDVLFPGGSELRTGR